MAFDKVSYDNEYRRKNYDRLSLMLPKGKKKVLKEIAKDKDTSVNAVVVEALETHYGIDLSK